MSAIRRNIPVPVNAFIKPCEAVDVEIEFYEHCQSKYLHIPAEVAGLLALKSARYGNFERVGPIGCTVFAGASEVDPFQARFFFPGQKAILTFENRSAQYVELRGALVAEVD